MASRSASATCGGAGTEGFPKLKSNTLSAPICALRCKP